MDFSFITNIFSGFDGGAISGGSDEASGIKDLVVMIINFIASIFSAFTKKEEETEEPA